MNYKDLFDVDKYRDLSGREIGDLRDFLLDNAFVLKSGFDKDFTDGNLKWLDNVQRYKNLDSIEFVIRTPLFKYIHLRVLDGCAKGLSNTESM